MNEELVDPQRNVPEDDVNTTPPNPVSNNKTEAWKMPEPVFRKTSGYLPQGYEKRYPEETVSEAAGGAAAGVARSASEEAIDIEPQPDISEQFDLQEGSDVEATPAQTKKSGAGRVLLIILGILLALGLVLVFIAVVYYLFFMPSVSSPF